MSAGVLLACVAIGTILGDLPEPLWLLVVPIGMLGSVITGITSLALALVPRHRG